MRLSILSTFALIFMTGFIFAVSYKYGFSHDSDVIFLAMTVCSFLAYIPQCYWESIMPKIINSNCDEKSVISNVLIVNLFSSIIVGLFLLLFYLLKVDFLYTSDVWNNLSKYYLFFVFLSQQLLLKRILHSLGHFEKMYYIDIIYGVTSLFLICTFYKFDGVEPYVLFVSVFISVIYGVYSIRSYIKFKDVLYFDRELFVDSTKLKIASICYSIKDLIFPALMMSLTPGLLTAYSFASKIINALLLIAITPQNNVFVVKCIKIINDKKCSFHRIKKYLFEVEVKTVSIYISLILMSFLGYKFVEFIDIKDFSNMDTFTQIYFLLSLYYLVVVTEQPIARMVFAFGKITETMFVNIINLIVFVILYFFRPEQISIEYIFIMLMVPQLFNVFIYTLYSRDVLLSKEELLGL